MRSKSESKQAQESLTQGSEQEQYVTDGGEAISIANAKGNVKIRQQGLDARDVLELVEGIGGGVAGVMSDAYAAGNDANQTTRNIAEQATGTSSETGRLVQAWTIPAAILAGLWLLMRGKR